MMDAQIQGIGLFGPGLSGWDAAGPVLQGAVAFEMTDVVVPPPQALAPRERRRTSGGVRLALAAAGEAVAAAQADPKDLPAVFGWAHGDIAVAQKILIELATHERYVSPTDFHNSVHNVAAGYWAIATGSHQHGSSVAAARDTFPASLLKAMAQVHCEKRAVLLVVCDLPCPAPLDSVCHVDAPFGFAMVLAPADGCTGLARISVGYHNAAAKAETGPRVAELRELAELNSAARALPLLEHLARRESAPLQVPYGPQARLDLELQCC